MSEAEYQIIKSIGVGFALGAAVLFQFWRPHRALHGSWAANSGLAAFNVVVLGLVCTGCACAVSRWADLKGIGLMNQFAQAPWLGLAVSVAGLDAVAYLWHRANHSIPLLWRFHQAHHSDPSFTTTTALRFHPGELLISLPVRLVTVVALGLPIAGVIVFEAVFAFANFFEHGNIALGRRFEQGLAWVFVTPALHRLHHSRDPSQLDTNYGTILTLWDRVLGTLVASRSDVLVDTGLTGIEGRLDTLAILRLPLAGVFGRAASGR